MSCSSTDNTAVTALISAPFSSKHLKISTFPLTAAKHIGVPSYVSTKNGPLINLNSPRPSTSAPYFRSNFTQSRCPFSTAIINSVTSNFLILAGKKQPSPHETRVGELGERHCMSCSSTDNTEIPSARQSL